MDETLSLLQQMPQVTEAWEERTYRVYWNNREIVVTMSDQGPHAGIARYSASVQDARGTLPTKSNGNPAGTPEGALDNVHWSRFTTSLD
ncbi:hypothetical protein EDF38_3095 [Frigoribacterium sp. PhB160]|uniref:hypothetical protein n=1 Tax=Frigoribacterium sp. PhB160 TaxID=2485192 RepID=UPI000F91D739|nr:hypothetical protein [Frigoribacterium sp. PhB160]ROS58351.1 hypothetical protein EDF38_3095 [Frigoribacterium sp. PhB160]